MDALVGLLDGPRARGAFLLRAILNPPWCLRIQDEAPLTLVAMVRGDACVIPDAGLPVRLRPGDVAILRGPDPYTVADDPATPIQAVIHPGQRSTTMHGDELCAALDLGVRTWGTSLDGPTVMLVGTYQLRDAVSQRLLVALPGLIVLPSPALDTPLITLLATEIVKDEPGQEAVLDRLLDLLLIAVLRAWFSRPDAGAPAWYRAHSDPVVGRALRLLHNDPSRPWTVASLAAAVGISRAALARRFTDLVGEPPMSYLTSWRLTLAADLLREPNTTLTTVARQVGYSTPFALSAAFKRVHGISPQEHRIGAHT
jgi:AraC-like DNA-binding protein